MARVAITEYAAKKLCFADSYTGVSATLKDLDEAVTSLLDSQTYVVKVDTGLKKRGKQGLLMVDVAKNKVESAAEKLFHQGYDRVLIEPFVAHEGSAERYLSLDLTREGAQLLYSDKGGIEIEDEPDSVKKEIIPLPNTLAGKTNFALAGVPLNDLLSKMQEFNLSFLEINPYLALNNDFIALDMAVEIDSTKENKLPDWAKGHILHKKAVSTAEQSVLEQDSRTAAALNLHTLNPDGSILTLLSGGGASLVALDSLVEAGLQDQVINYSEYSGAPTRDETALYASTLLQVLFDSKAKNKVILVAGGVANFTDVRATFSGIIDAFSNTVDELKAHKVYVCVRRGGPNQAEGLANLQTWLEENNVPHDVHDPSLSLGQVGQLVKKHL